jgi:hypothetical protein
MSEPHPSLLRRALSWIRHHPVETIGAAAVAVALTQAPGAETGNSQPTLNPDQQRIHQVERNGMPQSDEAIRLDKQFPADHVQTKDVIITSSNEILTAPTNEADRANNDSIIINGDKFVNEKQITLSNGLEITTKSGRYLVLMNITVGGQQTTLYVNEATTQHPFGDQSVPVGKDANGGYESTDGSIPAAKMEIFTTPQASPLGAKP